jgi:hypothetical protein
MNFLPIKILLGFYQVKINRNKPRSTIKFLAFSINRAESLITII